MSFQTIFEIQQSMTVNNRRTVGQQVSRGGQIRTAQYLTSVPWVFTVTPHNYLYYPQVRNVIQTIDNLDRQTSAIIQFNSPQLSWFTAYKGEATSTPTTIQLNTAPATNSQTLVLKGLPTLASPTSFLFRAGDFICINDYTYKITADVLRGSGTTVSVNIHRPIIGSPIANTTVLCGNNCLFNVYAEVCPTYTLVPMTNGAFVSWDQPFVFRENVAP